MEIQSAISKFDRYASRDQSNKVEVIERPAGGLSIVMAEAELAGQPSSVLSLKVVHGILSLIAAGVHDCASARSVLQNAQRDYNGLARLNISIISCDLQSQTVVITKNNLTPLVLIRDNEASFLTLSSDDPEDLHLNPSVFQYDIEADTWFGLFSNGVWTAGQEYGQRLDILLTVSSYFDEEDPKPHELADIIINEAVSLDLARPHDDMTVIVMRIANNPAKNIRRQCITLPLTIHKNQKESL